MPRFLIHIGPHKTGTTYLQHGFARLGETMLSRGIIYPEIWGSFAGHHSLAADIMSGSLQSLPEAFDQLRQCPAEIILLSSETFAYFGDAEIRQLHSLIDGEPVTIVFYARRWSELIPSCWQEIVKHGSIRTLPEFALSCLANPWTSPIVNFDLVLAKYRAVFGAASIRLVSYNAVLDAGEDLLSHFCRLFLGWPDLPDFDTERVNVSHNVAETEIVRALNALEWTRAREGQQLLYHRYARARAALPLDWLIQQMNYEADAILIDDATSALAQLHGQLFEQYRSALVPPNHATDLFRPRARPVTHIRTDYLMTAWVMETLRAVQAKLLAMPDG